jgi:glycosyltransferase involved in cell wall biosynthesis
MRILFALAGLHRVHRGAEVVFESVAQELALAGDDVLVIGSGRARTDRAYRFLHVPCVPRERFERLPSLPLLRGNTMYEELTFAAPLALLRIAEHVDVTATCGYPYTNWVLRARRYGGRRAAHVFVTQNGDWPAIHRRREYRFFSCDGLLCTNPVYFERNRAAWFATLVPNGVDPARFHPGPGDREGFGLPEDRPVVLVVSALIETKRVVDAIRAVAKLPDPFLVVAGDGPLRAEADALGAELLPGRYLRASFPFERMPDLYRSADVFLHPALSESFGNVYVEALASGLPVVANDDPVPRWILGAHGTLVDARDSDALAAGITSALATATRDRAARAAFAVEHYSWKEVASQYRAFFAQVAARRASTRK